MNRPAPRRSGLTGSSPAHPAPASTPVPETTTDDPAGPGASAGAGGGRALTKRPPRAQSTKRIPEGKVQFTVYVPTDTRAEARGAAKVLMAAVEGPNSLSELVAEAIEEKLERLRNEFNGGQPFAAVEGNLPTGRTPGA